jgi:hypothetical protein
MACKDERGPALCFRANCALTSRLLMKEGRWRVYERQNASRQEIFVFLSPPFRKKADAEKERDRMIALPHYKGRSLGITFVAAAIR